MSMYLVPDRTGFNPGCLTIGAWDHYCYCWGVWLVGWLVGLLVGFIRGGILPRLWVWDRWLSKVFPGFKSRPYTLDQLRQQLWSPHPRCVQYTQNLRCWFLVAFLLRAWTPCVWTSYLWQELTLLRKAACRAGAPLRIVRSPMARMQGPHLYLWIWMCWCNLLCTWSRVFYWDLCDCM